MADQLGAGWNNNFPSSRNEFSFFTLGNLKLKAFQDELVQIIPELRVYARSRVTNQADADDLVQKALVRALEKRSQFKGGKLIAWVISIMKNIWVDDIRKMTAQIKLVFSDEDEDLATDPRQEIAVRLSEVNNALVQLAENCREILVLFGGGYTYDEIGDKLTIPKGTVMSRLSRCRNHLTEKLA